MTTTPETPASPPHISRRDAPNSIQGPAGRLEIGVQSGRNSSNRNVARPVAILAHPHPLYGGDMDNAVVRRTAQRLEEHGFDTVRFNFRGVGNSDGAHDGGQGEIADLAAVFQWSRSHFHEATVLLAGYSFGAATILRSEPLEGVRAVLLIAPPLSFYDLSKAPMTTSFGDHSGATPVALIYGGNDELTAAPHREQTKAWRPRTTEELPSVGHDLGAAGSAEQRLRFDAAVDRCLDALSMSSEGTA